MHCQIVVSPGTALTLLHNACRPPLVSLPSSGQALSVFPSASATSCPAAASVLHETSRPVAVLIRAPAACPASAPLRVSPGRRAWLGAWRYPHRTRRPKRRAQSERRSYTTSLFPGFRTTAPNQSQTHQLSQYRCHPGGKL